MKLSLELEQTINSAKEKAKDLNLFEENNVIKEQLSTATIKTIDKAADYVIKAMPLPDAIKDILKDIKESIKTKDFKHIIKTAIKSSVREGLELLGVSAESVKSIQQIKDIAVKGGLGLYLENGIGIIENNYLKNNIVGDYVYEFFDKLKNYILTNEFKAKLGQVIEKMIDKKRQFLENCTKWYNAYSDMDLEGMNRLSKLLAKNKEIMSKNPECAKENKIIQNMTSMLNNKESKLSTSQLQLCESL